MRAMFVFILSLVSLAGPVAVAAPSKPQSVNDSAVPANSLANPESLQLNERGIAAVKARDFVTAESLFKEAMVADSKNLTAIYNLAGMYINNKKEAAAVQLLTDTIAIFPGDAGIHARLGDAYLSSKQIELAVKSYEQAVKLDANQPQIYRKLGNAYVLSKRLPDAERMLLEAIKQHPEDAESLGNLSNIYLLSKKPEEAVRAAKRALQVRSTPQLYSTLGQAYEIMRDLPNALISYQKAIALGDNRPELKERIEAIQKLKS